MSKGKINWPKLVAYMQEDLFFSQKELAEHCNVTQQSISNWKQNVRSPGPYAKRKLVELIENAGLRINTFYANYNAKQQVNQDDALTELVELFNTLPQQRKEFILELTRFEHQQNI